MEEPVDPTIQEPASESERLPVVSEKTEYLVICVPPGSPPKLLHAFTKKDVAKLIREIRSMNDQQFLYVIRGGELAKLYKSRRGLSIRFTKAEEQIKVPLSERQGCLTDGWIGE